MRIEVLALSGDGPVYDGVLRLGDVTILTGRNDAGKTRVLDAIQAGLAGDTVRRDLEVFGVATSFELQRFLLDPDEPSTWILDAESAVLTAFASAVELPPCEDGVRVGVLSPGLEDLLPGWRYGRPLVALDESTRRAIEQMLEDENLGQKHPDDPLKLESLGGFDPRILPEAVLVPCDQEEMDLLIAAAIIRLTRALRALASIWQQIDDVVGPLPGGPPVDWVTRGPAGEPSKVQPSWEWLLLEDEDMNTSHVHPAAEQACTSFERILTRLLPGFIGDDYWVRVIPRQPTAIARGAYIKVEMQRRDPVEGAGYLPDEDGEWFALADVASGFTVWLQLALREAVGRITHVSYLLQQHVVALHLIVDEGNDRIDGVIWSWEEVLAGRPASDETDERDERVAHRLDGLSVEDHQVALEELLAWLTDPRLPLPVIPDQPIFEPPSDRELFADRNRGEALETLPRGRLYLLDEPEQRLHPLLQRRAARWLGTLMSQWDAQCVVATHSVAFMSLPGDTFTYEITRDVDRSTIVPLRAGSLTPYSQLAREMGLDRGELLSLTRAFLITTPAVAAMLEELSGGQLNAAGIALIPLETGDQATELLAAALLTNLTAAPLAVLFTSLTVGAIEQLRSANAKQRVEVSRSSPEAATAAALIDRSLRQGREVEVLTLRVDSVLDLLDAGTVARTVLGAEPFTSHEAAHELHRTTTQPYEQFVADTYGITRGEDLIRTISRDMHNAGIAAPQQVSDAMWRLEQLALSSESVRPDLA